MAITDTVQPVVRPRGDLTLDDREALLRAMSRREDVESEYRLLVVRCIEASSFRAVAEVTGHSTDTLQRWKATVDSHRREHGGLSDD